MYCFVIFSIIVIELTSICPSTRAMNLASEALKAVRELNALEDAMASEAPDVYASFVANPRHSLKNVEETLGAVVDECGKSK